MFYLSKRGVKTYIMSRQSKLESFFKIEVSHDPRALRCFVYDPFNRRATFTSSPDPQRDKYITKKAGIHLYYRELEDTCTFIKPRIDAPNTDASTIPLLKSNLQKAIRRGNTHVAINTTFWMLEKARTEFFRRLAIIYIEDVCLQDSYSIIVWFMMSNDEHTLRPTDYYIILNIVRDLCECSHVYTKPRGEPIYKTHTHLELQHLRGQDQLLALYYRFLYGGMKGDMEMLSNAISYYIENPAEIVVTKYAPIDIVLEDTCLTILDVAIDFHPFPHLLRYISNRTGMQKERVNQLIWEAESAYNIRKLDTMSTSQKRQAQSEWIAIFPYLSTFRATIM